MLGAPASRQRRRTGQGALAALSALAVVTGGPFMTTAGPASAAMAAAGHSVRKAQRSAATLCNSSASRPQFFVDEAQQPPLAKPDADRPGGWQRGGGKRGGAEASEAGRTTTR
jgi:hypothetical protein